MWVKPYFNESDNCNCSLGFPGSIGKESACQYGTWKIRVWSLGQEELLEYEVETHCSILAWKIPWIEEPGYSPESHKGSDVTEHTYTE